MAKSVYRILQQRKPNKVGVTSPYSTMVVAAGATEAISIALKERDRKIISLELLGDAVNG